MSILGELITSERNGHQSRTLINKYINIQNQAMERPSDMKKFCGCSFPHEYNGSNEAVQDLLEFYIAVSLFETASLYT